MSKKNIQNTKRTKKKNTRTTNTMDTQKHTKPKHTTQLPKHIQLKKKTTSDSTATIYLIKITIKRLRYIMKTKMTEKQQQEKTWKI